MAELVNYYKKDKQQYRHKIRPYVSPNISYYGNNLSTPFELNVRPDKLARRGVRREDVLYGKVLYRRGVFHSRAVKRRYL